MAKAKADGCTVRMYCQGLGDCFLLSFPTGGGAKRAYVMIDCGVILGTPAAAAKMEQVVADIAATVPKTGGKPVLDLLIVTHEHWDHVSGFVQVPDLFDRLRFRDVWLAWTESDEHPLANQIRADRRAKGKALRMALAAADDPTAAAALEVLDFFGPRAADKKTLAAAGVADPDAASTDAAMARLRARATKFCAPGERLPLPGAAGVFVNVLGPPENLTLLKRDAPRKGKDEAYEEGEPASPFAALAWRAADDAGDAGDPPCPFDARYRVPDAEARADPFFRERYGFPDDPLGDAGEAWRRIEDEWLVGAAHLAIKMDSDTNNTSLAVAFELPDGRTLVFPGDAQMGNWESWAGVRFALGGDTLATGTDLLRRAVVYKVGHHGSHNATRKAGGLEEMTAGGLVALVPTDEAMAATKGVRTRADGTKSDGWKMPFAPLYARLQELCGHRILRADRGEKDLNAEAAAGRKASARLWDAFRPRVTFSKKPLVTDPVKEKGKKQPLYVEYALPPGGHPTEGGSS